MPSTSLSEVQKVLVLEGTFDDEAALWLLRELESLAGTTVVVDLSRVARFADRAVAVLAARSRPAELRFRGVDSHRSQVLKAFRFSVESQPQHIDS